MTDRKLSVAAIDFEHLHHYNAGGECGRCWLSWPCPWPLALQTMFGLMRINESGGGWLTRMREYIHATR